MEVGLETPERPESFKPGKVWKQAKDENTRKLLYDSKMAEKMHGKATLHVF